MDRLVRKAAIKATQPVKSAMTVKQKRQAAKSAQNIMSNLKSKSANKTEIGF